jgi:DNA-binding transcriptional LysR family regulator
MGEAVQLNDRIGRRLKLHDLHVLMAVAQAGSMSKAAVLLNTGQPAISRSIAELEHALGVCLLDRNRQGVKPTKYGHALLDGGTMVFDDLRQTVKNIEFLADPTVGEVRIGGNPFLAATFVSAAVDRLSRRYPRMVFRLVPGSVGTLHRELSERNVDVLVTRKFGPITDEQFNFERLFDDSYSVVVSAQNPLARRRKVELAELMNEPWVLPAPDGPLGSVAVEAFRASGLDYPQAAVIGPAEVRASLLATGRFISIVPNSGLIFSTRPTDLKVLPVRHPFNSVPVGVVTFKNRTISPVANLFIDSCRELARQRAKEIIGKRGGHQ